MRCASVWLLFLFGCNFDSSSLGSGSSDGEGTTTVPVPGTTQGTAPGTTAGGTGTATTTATTTTTTQPPGTTDEATTSTTQPPGETSTSGTTTEPDCLDDPDCLVPRGLLVRYFLDEADAGTDPPLALDSADDPLDLDLAYFNTMAYVEVDGNRGLTWPLASVDGGASTPVDKSKIASLTGSTTATVELVLEYSAVDGSASRFLHVGQGSEGGLFTVRSNQVGTVMLTVDAESTLEVAAHASLGPRAVIHMVYDSDAAAAERVEFYIDGELADATSATPPSPGQTIDLGTGRQFVLGNRQNGGRSFQGVLYYAALYTEALTLDEIEHNAVRLAVNDDA